MTVYETTSVLLALLGLLGGVVGFIRAVAADRRSAAAAADAADARGDAAAALKQSAAATERIAAAVEILAGQGPSQGALMADRNPARLAALIGLGEVDWTLERRVPAHSYRLRNQGTIAARDVGILGGSTPESTSLALVEPGTAITFNVDPDRHSRAIEVSWREDEEATPTRRTLPLPSAAPEPG
jgi:hypothetical protein